MEKNSRRIRLHSERPFIADEVNFMSAPRQFFAQRRGENSAPADGRITGDADFQ
jgi:hypothetical protein